MATQIVDDGASHHYRTEIPNTIIRGTKSHGLSVYAKWLYVYLKSVTGDRGMCYRSSTMIAQESGMSRGQVSAAKKALAHQGLIIVASGKNPRRDADRIRIKDLWLLNTQEFSVHAVNTIEDEESYDKYGNTISSVQDMNTENAQSSPPEHKSSPPEHKSSPPEHKSSPDEHQEDPFKKIPLRRSPEEDLRPPIVPPGDDTRTAQVKKSATPRRQKTLFPFSPLSQEHLKISILDAAFDMWYAGTGLQDVLTQPDLGWQWEQFALDAQANGRVYASWRQAFQKWLGSNYQARRKTTSVAQSQSQKDAVNQQIVDTLFAKQEDDRYGKARDVTPHGHTGQISDGV